MNTKRHAAHVTADFARDKGNVVTKKRVCYTTYTEICFGGNYSDQMGAMRAGANDIPPIPRVDYDPQPQ